MAFITLNREKLTENYRYLENLMNAHNIEWAVVVKVLCGNEQFLNTVINDLGVNQVCDSRITNLRRIKAIAPHVQTVFIKPPPAGMAERIVEFADVSFNTELATIKRLSKAAVIRDKVHKIVIMIELGELREGVMREQFIEFYENVFQLPNIEVIGIGTNLTCMYGVLPSHDKLIQLSLYKQLVEARFNRKIPYVSGGSSVTLPLIEKGLLPEAVNHFRIGETLFLGTDVYNNEPNPELHQDIFKLFGEIIELNEKPSIPDGETGKNLMGQEVTFNQELEGVSSFRAIVDIGLLDVEEGHITPVSPNMSIAGVSSDMIVIDLGDNLQQFKVGDLIEFRMSYMGILRIMHSTYIDKYFEDEVAALKSLPPRPVLKELE